MADYNDSSGNDCVNCSSAYYAMNALNTYFVTPFAIVTGMFGNILVVMLLYRMQRKRLPSHVFLMTLAIFDFIYMITLTFHWLSQGFGVKEIYSHVMLRLILYMNYLSDTGSILLIVGISMERLIVLFYPRIRRYENFAQICRKFNGWLKFHDWKRFKRILEVFDRKFWLQVGQWTSSLHTCFTFQTFKGWFIIQSYNRSKVERSKDQSKVEFEFWLVAFNL